MNIEKNQNYIDFRDENAKTNMVILNDMKKKIDMEK